MQTKVMKKARGLTLVEMLTVLVVVGILLALAVPPFRNLLVRRSVDVALSNFIDDLNLARAEAIQRGYFVTICSSVRGTQCDTPAGSWDQGWIVCTVPGAASGGAITGSSSPQVLRRQGPLAGIVSFQASGGASATATAVSFSPFGIAPGAQGDFVATADASVTDGQRKLCLSGAGRVAAC